MGKKVFVIKFLIIIFVLFNIFASVAFADFAADDIWKFQVETRLGVDQVSENQGSNNTNLGLLFEHKERLRLTSGYNMSNNLSGNLNYTNMNFKTKLDLYFSPLTPVITHYT